MFNPQKGMPIGIKVRNVSDKPQTVSLFDVNQLFDPALRNPDLRITSRFSGLTYTEICAGLMAVNCTIGKIYCYVDRTKRSGNASVKNPVFEIRTKDYFGTQIMIPIRAVIDPYQTQADVYYVDQEFRIDELTTVSVEVPADSEIDLLFFTKDERTHEKQKDPVIKPNIIVASGAAVLGEGFWSASGLPERPREGFEKGIREADREINSPAPYEIKMDDERRFDNPEVIRKKRVPVDAAPMKKKAAKPKKKKPVKKAARRTRKEPKPA